jgi:hypothetical protein
MERNIRIKNVMCSTRKMRVSDDEGYDDRCDEFMSQDLSVNAVNHVRKNNAEKKHTKATVQRSNHPSLLTTNR